MGSAETAAEVANYLNTHNETVGVVVVDYRPFSVEHFVKLLPATVQKIAVLDRTKGPVLLANPFIKTLLTPLSVAGQGLPRLWHNAQSYRWRYGLSSKDFTPAMVKGVFDELAKDNPKPALPWVSSMITNLSIDYDPSFEILSDKVIRLCSLVLGLMVLLVPIKTRLKSL